jgi:predicted ATPase
MGVASLCTGDIVKGHGHLNRALALYDPAEHQSLSIRFGQDMSVVLFYHRSLALWFLGYPNAAVVAAQQALTRARETGQAATLMYALAFTTLAPIFCGDFETARVQLAELVSAADQRGIVFWKAVATSFQGVVRSLTGEFSSAEQLVAETVSAYRLTGSRLFLSWNLSNVARAAARVGQFGVAHNSIREAVATVEETGERWTEPEVHRAAGEIELMMPKRNAATAEAHFERSLAVARQQQAKSWELRAAMSMAQLWRDQGKPQQARELLAPIYGWFTEGFDTLDLREAKALLDKLA